MRNYLRAAAALLLSALLAACAAPVDVAAENAGLGQPRRVCRTEDAAPTKP